MRVTILDEPRLVEKVGPVQSLTAELIRRVQNGDQEAMDQLHTLLRPYVRQLAENGWTEIGNGDASDLTQETLLQVAKSIPGYRSCRIPQFEAWIQTILRNKTVDLLRQKSPAVSLDGSSPFGRLSDRLPTDGSTPSSPIIRTEEKERLEHALQQLPGRQALAVRLRYLEGLSIPEICPQLKGRSEEAVRQLVHRGIVKLSELLSE